MHTWVIKQNEIQKVIAMWVRIGVTFTEIEDLWWGGGTWLENFWPGYWLQGCLLYNNLPSYMFLCDFTYLFHSISVKEQKKKHVKQVCRLDADLEIIITLSAVGKKSCGNHVLGQNECKLYCRHIWIMSVVGYLSSCWEILFLWFCSNRYACGSLFSIRWTRQMIHLCLSVFQHAVLRTLASWPLCCA